VFVIFGLDEATVITPVPNAEPLAAPTSETSCVPPL